MHWTRIWAGYQRLGPPLRIAHDRMSIRAPVWRKDSVNWATKTPGLCKVDFKPGRTLACQWSQNAQQHKAGEMFQCLNKRCANTEERNRSRALDGCSLCWYHRHGSSEWPCE